MTLTPEELRKAIDTTKGKIVETKALLSLASNSTEIRRLKRQLKELQLLQLWHMDQMG